MPDIFGQEAVNYVHLENMRAAGFLDSMNATLRSRGRAHAFDALPDNHRPRAVPFNDQEANAQAVNFLTNNFQAIQAQIEEVIYLDFRLDEFFPMKTDVPEGARAYSYRVTNHHGQGSFIENNGSNAQSAMTTAGNVPYGLEYAGILPEWTLEDLRNSAFGGIALDTETIRAATEGCMDHIEQVGLTGAAPQGFLGITNMVGPVTDTAAKAFSAMTGDELVKFVQDQCAAIVTSTNEVFGRVFKSTMAIYLPIAQANILNNLPFGDNRDKSVWDYVKVNNLWAQYTGKPLEIRIVAEMSEAGAASADRCLFGFPEESRVWEMAMPISPRVITTVNKGFVICAPMEYKISGLNEKRTTAMRYIDGI